MTPFPLPADQEHLLITYIRSGAYPWTAAECIGVEVADLRRWLRRGRQRPDSPFGAFRRRIRQAQAHARVMMEISLRQNDGKFWLSCGPGRERPGLRGWASPVRLETVPRQPERFPLVANRLLSTFLKLLEPYPDLRRQFNEQIKSYVPDDELDAVLNPDSPSPPVGQT